jgi:hypothetical protein
MIMSKPKVFEVTAVEHFEREGDKEITDPVIHLWRLPIVGTDAVDVEFQVKRKLTSGLKSDKAVQALSKRLKIEVNCPF